MTDLAADTPPDTFACTDLNDPKTFDDPWAFYAWLRDRDTLWRDPQSGMWAAATHEDVQYISRTPDLYSAAKGVRPLVPVPMSIISMDDPEHSRQRRIISRGFTPKRVRELAPHIRELTNQTIDEVVARGEIDFVEDFAIHVPLIVIAEMMGLDPAIRKDLYRWSDAMMDGDGHVAMDDPKLLAATDAFIAYTEVCRELIEDRRENPRDDLISILTSAYDEGELEWDDDVKSISQLDYELSNDELLMFCVLLVVAGNETTRNAITGGLRAFSRFPEQKARLLAEPELWDLATDEIIRFVSPVLSFIRTVTRDHTYKGVELKEGDQVLMLYQSANRDAAVFDAPDEFRVDRSPNPHIAFGYGPHFCLGANLARLEVKLVFEELFKRLPDISTTDPDAPIDRGDSALVLAIQHLPAAFGVPAGVTATASASTDTRERIQRIALELMSADGAAAVSMRQLAKACDLNVATLYHHFPSKEDLIASVIADRNYLSLLGVGLPIDASLAPRERLATLVRTIWAGAIGETEVWRLVIGESLRSTDAATSVVAELVGALRESLAGWLAEGFPELELDPAVAADVISGQVFGFFIEVLVVPPPADPSEYLAERADQLAAVLFPS